MSFKNFLFTTILATLSLPIFASAPLLDSIGIENQNGKKIIIHQLEAKENYYSLGRRYGIHPSVIMSFNNKAKLIVGATIKIPTEQSFETPTATKTPSSSSAVAQAQPAASNTKPSAAVQNTVPAQQRTPEEQSFIEYKVGAGETLFAIARRFNVTVDHISKTNNLKNNSIVPGQILKIKSLPQADNTLPTPNEDQSIVAQDSTSPYNNNDTSSRKLPNNRYGLYEKNEKGVAVWIDDANLDSSKKLVLHRFAAVGTVVKITNTMSNRTTFAKVVGRFTENETTKDVILVMTKDVAESLGAIDKRFHVSLSYGSPVE
jgi:LysM repeat protein